MPEAAAAFTGPQETAILLVLREADDWLALDEVRARTGVKLRTVRHHVGRLVAAGLAELRYVPTAGAWCRLLSHGRDTVEVERHREHGTPT